MPIRLSSFGPPNDELTDAGPAIQRMIDYGFNGSYEVPEFDFEGRELFVATSVTIPAVAATSNNVRRAVFNGRGAVIQMSGVGTTLFDRTYTTHGDADTRFYAPLVTDFTVWGTGSQSHFCRWWASWAAHYENISLSALDIGIENLWGLASSVVNCTAIGCKRPFRAIGGDTGDITKPTGATNTNSNSNLATYRNCRVSADDATFAGFYFSQVGVAKMEQCAIEGTDIDYGIFLEGNTAGGYVDNRSAELDGVSFEVSTSINEAIKMNVKKSIVTIRGLRIAGGMDTSTTNTFIDATGSQRSLICIERSAWQELVGTTAAFFKDNGTGTNGNAWDFDRNLIQAGELLTDSAKWSGGTLPAQYSETKGFGYG